MDRPGFYSQPWNLPNSVKPQLLLNFSNSYFPRLQNEKNHSTSFTDSLWDMNQIKLPAQSPPLDTLAVAVVIVNAHIKKWLQVS